MPDIIPKEWRDKGDALAARLDVKIDPKTPQKMWSLVILEALCERVEKLERKQ